MGSQVVKQLRLDAKIGEGVGKSHNLGKENETVNSEAKENGKGIGKKEKGKGKQKERDSEEKQRDDYPRPIEEKISGEVVKKAEKGKEEEKKVQTIDLGHLDAAMAEEFLKFAYSGTC